MTYYARSLSGRCRSGSDLTGTVVHLTIDGAYGLGRALCGKQPGRRSAGWSSWEHAAPTCRKCIEKAAAEAALEAEASRGEA